MGNEYQAFAKTCLEFADEASSEKRAFWLELARRWLRLAEISADHTDDPGEPTGEPDLPGRDAEEPRRL